MKLKGFIIVIFLLFGLSSSYSQVSKLRTTEFSIRTKEDKGDWSKWSTWEESNMLITFDTDIERITIYSNETQVYDIVSSDDPSETKEGETDLWFKTVDKNGLTCVIRMILSKTNNDNQLYVMYSDVMFVYNVYWLD